MFEICNCYGILRRKQDSLVKCYLDLFYEVTDLAIEWFFF